MHSNILEHTNDRNNFSLIFQEDCSESATQYAPRETLSEPTDSPCRKIIHGASDGLVRSALASSCLRASLGSLVARRWRTCPSQLIEKDDVRGRACQRKPAHHRATAHTGALGNVGMSASLADVAQPGSPVLTGSLPACGVVFGTRRGELLLFVSQMTQCVGTSRAGTDIGADHR